MNKEVEAWLKVAEKARQLARVCYYLVCQARQQEEAWKQLSSYIRSRRCQRNKEIADAIKTTKDRVKELRDFSPKMPAVVIARQIGVSRERVRQILVKLNLPTKFPPQRFWCRRCGKESSYYCSPSKLPKLCWTCYIEDCHEHHWTKLICPHCGKQFIRANSYIKRKLKLGQKLYCSRSCSTLAWLAERRQIIIKEDKGEEILT